MNNQLFSITGPSGVGKTTMAKLLACALDYDQALIISGDDAHKWPRDSKNWETFTHLNPEANNLEDDFEHLKTIKNNSSIKRKIYNHETGTFDKIIVLDPKEIIIYEGLHGLYSKKLRNITDLKIYVDTNEELKIAWKIKRDMEKRGYSEEEVLKTIQKRLADEVKYIHSQKKYADVIVRFVLGETGIEFNYKLQNEKYAFLFEKIKKLFNMKKEFFNVCKLLTDNEDLVQNKGGNVSFKFDNKILITSSGSEFKNIATFEGYCICDLLNPENIIYQYNKPSMELLAHCDMGNAVVHTHPKYLLSILCSKNCINILQKLYSTYNFDFIGYTTPGYKLHKKIEKCKNDIIFCENHGLFVSDNNLYKAYEISNTINKIAKDFINNSDKNNILTTKKHLFPDSAVLPEVNENLNNIIYTNIINCNLNPKYLTSAEIDELLNMDEEKYRRTL